jgi:hypothetical protein
MDGLEKRNLTLVMALAFLASLAWCLAKGRMVEGDDAIMGLMALKISRGEEFPVFFWQAHYSGPIASYLAAPLHWFFEPSPLVLHSVIIPIHLFYSAGMYFLARTWLGQREAMIAGLFAALSAQIFPYSALGGFTESMAFVPWIFLLCLGESKGGGMRNLRFLCGGLLCGFALWVFPLALPPVLACLICQQGACGGKSLKLTLAGCFLGLLPAIYHNISQPGATFLRLFARPSALNRQAASHILSSEGIISFFLTLLEKWAYSSYQALLSIPHFTLSLMGFAPDATLWSHFGGLITFLALLFGLWTFFRYQGNEKMIPRAILLTVIITYCFLVLFGLNRDRYLIPIFLIIPFGLTIAVQRLAGFLGGRVSAMAVAFVLLINCLANFWDTQTQYPDYQGLARFLQFNGLISGYASYTTAYPLVYLSNERLIYTPAFDDSQYDRHAEYTTRVARAEKPTFVFSDQRSADRFRRGLATLNASSKERAWGPFRVFHDLSPQVDIERLRSATATPTN